MGLKINMRFILSVILCSVLYFGGRNYAIAHYTTMGVFTTGWLLAVLAVAICKALTD